MIKVQDRIRPLFVIAGPTASGKTALAAELIKKYPLEIVSADSRQVYRRLDIGTGKDKSVPQHLIDVANPEQAFSVAHYCDIAGPIIDQIYRQGKIPLIVGGTGYYIESLIYNRVINDTPPNAKLRAELELLSNSEILDQIANADPATASNIDAKNRVRLIRALEIIRLTNAPRKATKSILRPDLEISVFMLDVPRRELYKRIDERVEARLGEGMIDEVRGLMFSGISSDWLTSLGLEYRFITQYLISSKQSRIEYDEMVARLKFAIHAYARRQLTFFRRWPFAKWRTAEQIQVEIGQSLRESE